MLLDYFNTVELTVEELHDLCEEYKINGERNSVNKLRGLGAYMYRNISKEPRIFHLKVPKNYYNKDVIENLIYEDFHQNEVHKNIFTWKNGNIVALYIIELEDYKG